MVSKEDIGQFSKLNAILNKFDIEIVIVDLLDIQEEDLKKLENKRLIVCFDDYDKIKKNADIVVNTSPTAKNLRKREGGTLFLGGAKYLPLKKYFLEKINKQLEEEVKSIMVSCGGSDRLGSTFKIIDALEHLPLKIKIIVVIGPMFKYRENVEKIAQKLSKNFVVKYSVENMFDLMKKIDLAICSPGLTIYELMAMGKPVLVIEQEEEQVGQIKKLEELGCIKSLGMHNDANPSHILAQTTSLIGDFALRKKLSENGKGLIDGRGSDRIVNTIFKTLMSGG